ncbi:HNH endonuclease signature motif containing protein [Brucella pituitosa]|uniref:HNH endonuclease n=1 Tax=Brucella pituitosa TaxID=571256 RepID=A0A643F0B9_9HYPH|nr:HNH endonuclease signature motif containing protein [Brucella pituitosa]KAB0570606.1 HNH endonuclease [Brucella pituitosa]
MTDMSPEFLKECFDLDADAGVLTWKQRPLEHFSSWKSWHSWTIHAAGKTAGNYRSDGYIRITIDKKRYYAHRIIYALSRGINLTDVPSEIDHIDKNHMNNRPNNLRPATRSQNLMNTALRADNTSGIKGVGFDKRRGG